MISLPARPWKCNTSEDLFRSCFKSCMSGVNDRATADFSCCTHLFSKSSSQSNIEGVLSTLKTRRPDESRLTLTLYHQTITILLWWCSLLDIALSSCNSGGPRCHYFEEIVFSMTFSQFMHSFALQLLHTTSASCGSHRRYPETWDICSPDLGR